jgi:hypothetical protein
MKFGQTVKAVGGRMWGEHTRVSGPWKQSGVAKTGGSIGTRLVSLAKFPSRHRLRSPLKPEISVTFNTKHINTVCGQSVEIFPCM